MIRSCVCISGRETHQDYSHVHYLTLRPCVIWSVSMCFCAVQSRHWINFPSNGRDRRRVPVAHISVYIRESATPPSLLGLRRMSISRSFNIWSLRHLSCAAKAGTRDECVHLDTRRSQVCRVCLPPFPSVLARTDVRCFLFVVFSHCGSSLDTAGHFTSTQHGNCSMR